MHMNLQRKLCDEKIKEDVQACIRDLESVGQKIRGKKKLTRKRSLKKQEWPTNKRKKCHEAGEEYIREASYIMQQQRKKLPAKKIVMNKYCISNCKFRCSEKIDTKTQENIVVDF